MLSLINKRETKTEFPHVNVYRTDTPKRTLIGYMMPEFGWTFTSKCKEIPNFVVKSKKIAVLTIRSLLLGDELTVKQNFGLDVTVNSKLGVCTYVSNENGSYEACNGSHISNEDLAKFTDNEKNQKRVHNSNMGTICTIAICPHCGKELTTAS